MLILFIILTLASPVHATGLNDTGIKTCSNETQNGLPCPVAGFPGQDAEYGTNSFNFTKLDANGNALPVTATNHSCVQDNVTGLMWEVKTDDGGLRDKDNTYTFDGTATFATQVNATNLCGHNDWRVPNPHELASIVDYSIADPGPTIDTNYFPNTLGTWFWTNSTNTSDSNYSWIVFFGYGLVSLYDWNSYHAVRLVRSGQWLLSFVNNNDGTITDKNTGLMWAKCSQGQNATDCSGSASYMTWQQALQAADTATVAGFTNWRLPNVKELQSLINYNIYNPAITISYFPNTDVRHYYWTSSAVAFDSSHSRLVLFYDGFVGSSPRDYSYAVRIVRDGQSSSFTVTPSAGSGGSVSPSTPQTVTSGATTNFTVTPDTGYTKNTAVSGTCPQGNWNGDVWTTGTITANCTVNFSFNVIPITAPTVTTLAATNIAATSTTLNGNVASSGDTAYVTFDFGTTTNYGTNSAATPYQVYSSSAVAVSASKTGLTCHTTYHYRVQASNSAGTSYGYNQSFTTAACPTYTVTPNVVGSGGSVSPNTQQTVNPNTSASFTVTPDNGYAINTSIGGTCPQGYWNGNVWTTGAITANCSVNFSFNLITAAPIVTTTGPSNITATSATLNGNVTSAGATATASFAFGPTNAYGQTIAANPAQITSTTPVAVSANKTGLTCNTIYNYRLQATNSVGTNYGANQSLQTAACPAFTVTPSVGNGGNVFPNAAQTVNPGSTASFTVTPNAAYTRNLTVGGTCPQGTWNSNVWTTGAITANCTVSFGFTIKTYKVTQTAGNGGTVSPSFQTVNHGATTSFTVTPNTGYTKNTAVTGTCPQGSWNGGSTSSPGVWTTGAITAPCSVNFSFTFIQVNAWLHPPAPTIIVETPFALNVYANSNSLKIGSYDFLIKYDTAKLIIDYVQGVTQCSQLVCPGSNGFTNYNVMPYSVTENGINYGTLRIEGSNYTTGAGPGTSLDLLKIYFKTQATTGTTTVNLTINKLMSVQNNPIGTQNSAGGNSVIKISPGLCGDADGNALVNIVDALAIARKLVSLPPPPTVDVTLADVNVNKDGVSIADAMHIARYSIGLVTPPEVCVIGKAL